MFIGAQRPSTAGQTYLLDCLIIQMVLRRAISLSIAAETRLSKARVLLISCCECTNCLIVSKNGPESPVILKPSATRKSCVLRKGIHAQWSQVVHQNELGNLIKLVTLLRKPLAIDKCGRYRMKAN